MVDGAAVNGWAWDAASHRWRVQRGAAYVTCASLGEPPAAASLFAVELAPPDAALKALAGRPDLNSLDRAAIRRVRHLLYGGDPDYEEELAGVGDDRPAT